MARGPPQDIIRYTLIRVISLYVHIHIEIVPKKNCGDYEAGTAAKFKKKDFYR